MKPTRELKHAALIKRWADGAHIQYRAVPGYGEWMDPPVQGHLLWDDAAEYRVKPEPIPDATHDVRIFWSGELSNHVNIVYNTRNNRAASANVRLVFDGETRELKSAEVIK